MGIYLSEDNKFMDVIFSIEFPYIYNTYDAATRLTPFKPRSLSRVNAAHQLEIYYASGAGTGIAFIFYTFQEHLDGFIAL